MDILGQSALLVGVMSFSLGFSVLSRNVRNLLFISFSTLTTLISGWSLSFFLDRVWPDSGFYRSHLLFNVLISPACLLLIRILIRIQDRTSRRILELSIILAIVLSTCLAFDLDSNAFILQMIYFSPVLVAIQTLQLMWIDYRIKHGVRRGPKVPAIGIVRKHLIYVGGLIVLMISVMDHIPWMGKIIPALGNLGLITYLFFLSQAITQQRLLNINALFSRFIVLLVVALTLTIVYTLLVSWIENSPALFFLNSFIASFLILMLLDPLRSMVTYFTYRLLTQKHRKLHQNLREAQRKITGIVDLGTLFHSVLNTTEQVLQPEWGALFVLRSDGTRFKRVRTIGVDPQKPTHDTSQINLFRPKEILARNPLIEYCKFLAKKSELPILLDQMLESEKERSASRIQKEHLTQLIEAMKALNSNVIIPLYRPDQVLGFITLRVSSPPEPWGNNWGLLPVLYPYYEQVAQAMQNMEVFVKQREKERLATLGEMAAGLAHEIRNPLGAIKGAAQFLDPSANRPESQFLKIIIEEVDRLNRVVTQFLDYSKPHATDLVTADLNEITKNTLDFLRPSLKEGIKLNFYPSKSPARVHVSIEQMRQVIINLIQNSLKALDEISHSSIQVSIELETDFFNTSLGNGEVILVVEDQGKGIKKENLDKLFIPFFTTSPSGTGLGLSISQKIIEAHRGRIEIVSEEGKFTKVSVILPYVLK